MTAKARNTRYLLMRNIMWTQQRNAPALAGLARGALVVGVIVVTDDLDYVKPSHLYMCFLG
jgi:hypothetical protein